MINTTEQLTPFVSGYCVRRLDEHRCLDVVEQLYNQRLVVTERPADQPHSGYESIEQGWCYYGFGTDDNGTPRTKRTAFIAAVAAARVWDGTGNPPGANKRAGAEKES
ncbi:hypothetical protein [Nocardia sp. A7]|uniref:hypothetical protein n=1 Tax=Nocardia sp. A7 TaxID=2789274 RepID=UPI00397A2C84